MYRTLRTPSFWREMDRLQRGMNRLFTQHSPSRLRTAPNIPHHVCGQLPPTRQLTSGPMKIANL
jgi:hypothetical protein